MKKIIQKLPWDSTFFNLEVGETDIDQLSLEYRLRLIEEGKVYDLIYLNSNCPFESNIDGFDKIELPKSILFQKHITKINQSHSKVSDLIDKSDSSQIISLAVKSGVYSRFKLDNRFPKDNFERLYKTWGEGIITKRLADEVLVYRHHEKVVGFVSVQYNINEGKIGLIAVDENFRGQGIAKNLIREVENRLIQKGYKQLVVVTQSVNHGAMKLYNSLGMEINEIKYVYHLWRNRIS